MPLNEDFITNFVLWLCLILSVCFLLRLLLIWQGLLKTPVMRSLQNYNKHSHYSLSAWLILWLGLFSVSGSILLLNALNSRFPLYLPGILLLFIAIYQLTPTDRNTIRKPHLQPYWYRELAKYSSLDEQRQIAYLWLRLPPRLKTYFELNDRAFFAWSDLVLLSIGAQVSDEFVHSRVYRKTIARLKKSINV